MPFDPTKPSNNSSGSSAEMRSQLTALHAEIQQRETLGSVANAIAGTAINPGGLQTFSEQGTSFSDGNDQQIAAKLDELITALRR
jgi:hypothetical protein